MALRSCFNGSYVSYSEQQASGHVWGQEVSFYPHRLHSQLLSRGHIAMEKMNLTLG